MSAASDMNGLWSGEYRYSGNDLSVRFTAAISECDGRFSGMTLEEAAFDLHNEPEEYEATIRGDRCGQHVWFTKLYLPSTGILQPPLIYSGAVDPAFTRVTGRWVLTRDSQIDGSFTLSRVSTGAMAAVLRATTA